MTRLPPLLLLSVIVTLTAGCASSSPSRSTQEAQRSPERDTIRSDVDTPPSARESEGEIVHIIREAYLDHDYEEVARRARNRLQDSVSAEVGIELRTLLGRAEQARGRDEAALKALRQARVEAYDAGEPVVHLDRAIGESLASLYRWPQAASAFRRVLEERPNDIAVRQALAEVYRRSRNWTRAREQYGRLVRADSTHGQWWARLAQTNLELEQMNQAIRHFARAHEFLPQSPDVALSLSGLYRTKEKPGAARRVIDTTLSHQSSDPRLWRRKGDLAFEQDDLDEAQQAYQIMMRVGDSTATALRRLGLIEVKREQFADAIAPLRESFRRNSLHPRTTLYLGISYAKVDSLEKGITFLERTVDRVADGPITRAYQHLGSAYNERDEVSASLDAYRMVLGLEPERTEVYFRLATVYDQHYREKTTAARYYRRFLSVADSSHRELRAYAENRLDALRTTLHMEGQLVDSDTASER